VYIDTQNNKELPATPDLAEEPTFNHSPTRTSFEGAGRSASPGFGRKASIMKKVGKVVRNRP
jgi:hypothetical protein